MDTLLMCRGAAAGGVKVIDFDYLEYYDRPIESSFPFADWMIEGMHEHISHKKYGIDIRVVTR
ncbi:MAG: hypothetical protein J6Z40_03860 [Oscillospiraceae bacterium]|nr:hypothetical protein [Oscillospiraceae bacterium]